MFVGIDTETHLISPCQQAPKLVCVSYSTPETSGVLLPEAGVEYVETLLKGGHHIVGHNIAFDMPVLLVACYKLFGEERYLALFNLVIRAYLSGQIHDTMTREKLLDMAKGRLATTGMKADLPSQQKWKKDSKSGYYSLAGVLWRRLKLDVGDDKGEAAVRMRYAEVDGLPLEEWPHDFYRYAMEDAIHARQVAEDQEADEWAGPQFPVERFRTAYDFVLRLTECRGQRTDPFENARLEAFCREAEDLVNTQLRAEGWIRKDGVLDNGKLRDAVERAYFDAGEEVPRTSATSRFPQGQIKTDAETLDALPNMPLEHPLSVYRRGRQAQQMLTKNLVSLRKGEITPLHPRYNSLLVTGRTSASDYTQTPPRLPLDCFRCGTSAKTYPSGAEHCPTCKQWVGDVRRCYEATPGFVLCSVDYSQLELCTLAQSCFDLMGHSSIGDAINQGLDLHSALAAEIMGLSLDEYLKLRKAKVPKAVLWRNASKGANFGIPGKMSPTRFLNYLRVNFGISEITLPMVKQIFAAYFRRWDDMEEFFHTVKCMGFGGRSYSATATIMVPRLGLHLGDRRLPAACNAMFQPLAAAGALYAGVKLVEAAYATPSSPMFGSRPVAFLHDEWIYELPEDRAWEAGPEMARIMREAMREWTPNVQISCEPALMRRWYKGAEAVYDASGRLVPWVPSVPNA